MNYKNGSIIGVDNRATVTSAKGVWGLNAIQQDRENGTWPVFLIKQLLDSSTLSSTSDNSWITKTYAFTSRSSADITGYVGATFYTLLTGGSANRWNRDSGGTGSSGTGNTMDGSGSSTGYYVYTETSGSHPMSMLLRTAEYTLAASGTFQWREGYWGSNLSSSTRDVYWIVS